MAGIYAEEFAHLFDFSPLRTQTCIPPNPVLFSPYPVLLNGPLVQMQCDPPLQFFFPLSSTQILHQLREMCSSFTFLGQTLKVIVLRVGEIRLHRQEPTQGKHESSRGTVKLCWQTHVPENDGGR